MLIKNQFDKKYLNPNKKHFGSMKKWKSIKREKKPTRNLLKNVFNVTIFLNLFFLKMFSLIKTIFLNIIF